MLDTVLHALSHSFFMMLFGLIFYFTLKWSIWRNKPRKIGFLHDQADEIIVSLIGGLIFLIWDDEILVFWYEVIIREEEHPEELKPYYYLMVGPAIERFYKIYEKLAA